MVWILYAPALRFEFLNLDDHPYLTHNDLIKSWHPLSLWRVMTEPVARNYAPLTIGTFLVEHTLWGLNPSGYHATNIALEERDGTRGAPRARNAARRNFHSTTWRREVGSVRGLSRLAADCIGP